MIDINVNKHLSPSDEEIIFLSINVYQPCEKCGKDKLTKRCWVEIPKLSDEKEVIKALMLLIDEFEKGKIDV